MDLTSSIFKSDTPVYKPLTIRLYDFMDSY